MFMFFIDDFEEHKKTYIQRSTTMMNMMTIISMNFMKKMTECSLKVLNVFFCFYIIIQILFVWWQNFLLP